MPEPAFILVGDTYVRADLIESVTARPHRDGALVRTVSGATHAAAGQDRDTLMHGIAALFSDREPDVAPSPWDRDPDKMPSGIDIVTGRDSR